MMAYTSMWGERQSASHSHASTSTPGPTSGSTPPTNIACKLSRLPRLTSPPNQKPLNSIPAWAPVPLACATTMLSVAATPLPGRPQGDQDSLYWRPHRALQARHHRSLPGKGGIWQTWSDGPRGQWVVEQSDGREAGRMIGRSGGAQVGQRSVGRSHNLCTLSVARGCSSAADGIV